MGGGIGKLGGGFILSLGCIYKAAHCYLCYWRANRFPTTLKEEGLKLSEGRVQKDLLQFARELAIYDVKPMGAKPLVRSSQQPYSIVQDNPSREAEDMWEDLMKGRLMLYTKRREHLVAPLMESRMAFVTQKDVAKPEGVKVRYISDPMIEINERIDPKTHPRVRVPKHANVIGRIFYWKRRYPTIPVLLCKRDVEGAFKLLPSAVCALPHVGVRFAQYMIMYLSLYFGWKPSPASWGVISSLIMQFVASFTPLDMMSMGPDGLTAYEYFDDGAFAEPLLSFRPWLSVTVWELGLQDCLGYGSLHEKKKAAEGECATSITLWGLNVCAESETISLPSDKLHRAQEFLTNQHFDPGVARIPLNLIQELRGKAEHWSLCNSSLGPELHGVDRMLRSYRGMSRPRGDLAELKQSYFDFWDTLEIFRINTSDPNWRSVTYRSSFVNVLSLPERMSFNEQRYNTIWVVSDATINRYAAVNHSHMAFAVFDTECYYDFLSGLTGLPRGDYVLIAIAEFLSLVAFSIAIASELKCKTVCYVGGNQNVVGRVRHKRPGNRVAKYFLRILRRLENENDFVAAPMYISTPNNRLQDELSRLSTSEAIQRGNNLGYTYKDIFEIVRHYFQNILSDFALLLPTDSTDTVCRIRQFVEKRIVRHIPQTMMVAWRIAIFGTGTNGWSKIRCHPMVAGLDWKVTPCPVELKRLERPPPPVGNSNIYCEVSACVFTTPHDSGDLEYLASALKLMTPKLLVRDEHPAQMRKRRSSDSPAWLSGNKISWSWAIHTALFGDPQMRERVIRVSVSGSETAAIPMAPLFIFGVITPAVLSEFLCHDDSRPSFEGQLSIAPRCATDILQPHPWGGYSCPTGPLLDLRCGAPAGRGL